MRRRRLHHEERGAVIIFVVAFLPVAPRSPLSSSTPPTSSSTADRFKVAGRRRRPRRRAGVPGLLPRRGRREHRYRGVVHRLRRRRPRPANQALGRTVEVQTRINATDYDAESYSDGMPCETGFIDVKLTGQDTSPFFPFIGRLRREGEGARAGLPSAPRSSCRSLPRTPSRTAKAIFVNEVTGAGIASTPLLPNGVKVAWRSGTTRQFRSTSIQSAHVEVRIAMSGKASFTGCGDSLVACYDADPTRSTAVSCTSAAGRRPAQPRTEERRSRAHRALQRLVCRPVLQLGVVLVHDRSSRHRGAGVEPAANAQLVARIGNDSYPLTYDPGTGTWSSGTVISIDPESGSVEVTLDWEQTSGNVAGEACHQGQQPVQGSFGVVQRSFAAFEAASGPIARAEVSRAGVPWANLPRACVGCCSLVVKIGIEGSLQLSIWRGRPSTCVSPTAARAAARLRPRRVARRARDRQRLQPALWPQQGNPVPRLAERPVVEPGALEVRSRRAGHRPPQPDLCRAQLTHLWSGTSRTNEGTARRIAASAPTTGRTTSPGIPESCMWWSRRSARSPAPATPLCRWFGSRLYVTGWAGQGEGFDNPCQERQRDEAAEAGDIVGRFINYIEVPNRGGGTDPCDFSAIDVCTAVLVD